MDRLAAGPGRARTPPPWRELGGKAYSDFLYPLSR